ncbi:MAG TPA: pro-sigmaK processing inhibitor BofA family protein [Candidatus Eisenbergiella merdipullorum]|uniref:Pro-sigmaK processing inhibitor BofA family protein n=1 Tax=Candidatus Eisenbergiella merdipullorum TaxID=2838553 RepID=A0A9D2L2N1_9FIRM|nr:pro-sigmaK processing inhibitor BofA family protein [Candidatus Eisenbergiella merdipullorum]
MIGAACLLVLLVAAMRSRTQILLNFILRAVLGLLIIYFVDSFLDGRGIPVHVGLGAVSLVMSGLLGAPGVLLLYGIGVCAWLLG